MARHACPVCGDPKAYTGWVDKRPPEGCPHDQDWQEGKAPSITNVTQCRVQMERAAQAAYFRKLAPEAFDASGNILPDGWGILGPKLPKGYVLK